MEPYSRGADKRLSTQSPSGLVSCSIPRWWSAPEIQSLVSALTALPSVGAERQAAIRRAGQQDRLLLASAEIRAAAAVLVDLTVHGWAVGVKDLKLELSPPAHSANRHEEKLRVQAQLASERELQVWEPSVRAFIARMERPRHYKGEIRSIFSLFREGRDLAQSLSAAGGDVERLREVVQPYLQVIIGDERDSYTGLLLTDVWRYFRHTWATPYKSTPGRSMALLVRDAAAPNHPVVGIALIGSTASQISCRDSWIGWSSDAVLDECLHRPSAERVAWLEATLRHELSEVFCADLLVDEVISAQELLTPSGETFARLTEEANLRRQEHRRFSDPAALKRATDVAQGDDEAWAEVARTPLYRAKRAEVLCALLRARAAITAFGEVSVESLARFAWSGEGAAAIRTLARRSKARRMGVSIGEISVCGAVSPYREILGGKLVSLLLMSSQVRATYAARYDESESVIASATAGRAIRREPALALLMTTSLYASSASQYNRLRLPRTMLGTEGPDMTYASLGLTEGFGSSHFSDGTLAALTLLLGQERDGQRYNSVFGEGVNPRLRKVREGLDLLGLPSSGLLRHGSARLVYAVPLADNVQRYLQGLDPEPSWSVRSESHSQSTEAISEWWRARWLSARSIQSKVISDVAQHTLVLPIRHGARVKLPDVQIRLIE